MANRMFLRHASGEKILLANQEHGQESWIPAKGIEKSLAKFLDDLHLKGEKDKFSYFDLFFDENRKFGYHI